MQSQVPEHAELHLLLSMITPLGWLERVPSYKDQQAELKEKDLATYGFLGYPLLQTADILLYRPAFVPVGEDQVAHVEITREVARRFNHLYGREPDFEVKVEKAIKGLGGRNSTMYKQLRKKFQENGDQLALEKAREVVTEQQPAHGGRPRAVVRLPGRRQRQHPARAARAAHRHAEGARASTGARCRSPTATPSACAKTRTRSRRSSSRCRPIRRACAAPIPGNPDICPVFDLHKIYSSEETRTWAANGCRTAGIGCLECKKPLIDKVVEEIGGIRKRAQEFEENPELVRNIVAEGGEKARDAARATLDDVRRAMNLRVD